MTQINPKFMWPYFNHNKNTCNLRKEPILYFPSTNSTNYGANSVHSRGSLIWNNLPTDIKFRKSASECKTKIKNFGSLVADVQSVVRLTDTLNLYCEITEVHYENN